MCLNPLLIILVTSSSLLLIKLSVSSPPLFIPGLYLSGRPCCLRWSGQNGLWQDGSAFLCVNCNLLSALSICAVQPQHSKSMLWRCPFLAIYSHSIIASVHDSAQKNRQGIHVSRLSVHTPLTLLWKKCNEITGTCQMPTHALQDPSTSVITHDKKSNTRLHAKHFQHVSSDGSLPHLSICKTVH